MRERVSKGESMSNKTQSSTVIPTSSNQSEPDTWENRIKQAAVFLGSTSDEVETILKEYGVEKLPAGTQMLSDEKITPFGDLRAAFCEKHGVPVPKLRMAMTYLRGPTSSGKTDTIDPVMYDLQQKYGIKTRLEDLGIAELLPYYNPKKQNRIFKVLQDMFGDKAVIAFKPDSKEIAIEETSNYITDVQDGLPEEDAIDVDGELVKLFPIGRMPDEVVDEDPLFPGQPLKRDRSIINRINWSGISKDVRQFVRLLVDSKEIDPNDRLAVRQLIKIDVAEGKCHVIHGIEIFKDIFPEIYMKYKELKKKDELPKLQLSLDDVNGKLQNPFSVNRSY